MYEPLVRLPSISAGPLSWNTVADVPAPTLVCTDRPSFGQVGGTAARFMAAACWNCTPTNTSCAAGSVSGVANAMATIHDPRGSSAVPPTGEVNGPRCTSSLVPAGWLGAN